MSYEGSAFALENKAIKRAAAFNAAALFDVDIGRQLSRMRTRWHVDTALCACFQNFVITVNPFRQALKHMVFTHVLSVRIFKHFLHGQGDDGKRKYKQWRRKDIFKISLREAHI